MKTRGLASKFLLIILICTLLIFPSALKLSRGQGIYTSTAISSDTSWTSANSPYNVAGSIVINSGATLTLETGTTLNLNGFMTVSGTLIIQPDVTVNIVNASGYIQVDGALSALGTSAEPIQFVGTQGTSALGLFSSTYYPSVTFSRGSTGWNAQTSTGSTLQNTIFSSVTVSVSCSAELSSDTFNNGLVLGGNSPVVANCQVDQGISIQGGAPIIADNTISGGITVNGEMYESRQTTYIENNVISGNTTGEIGGITILEFVPYGDVIIERNMINGGPDGIDFAVASNDYCPVQVENNTITNSGVGIDFHCGYPETVSGNNIYDNTLNVNIDNNHSFNCSNNWWGTTDQTTISNTIHDFKDDFTLGTINFTPYLTSPNPEATPSPNMPIPTPSETTSSATTPENATSVRPTTPQPAPQTAQTNQTINTSAPITSQNGNTTPTATVTVTEFLVVVAVLMVAITGLAVAVIVMFLHRKPSPKG